jgi:hypothetical protein
MNKTDETLKLAKECGATTYTNRHYPDATAVTFSPVAWEKFCEQAFAAPVQKRPQNCGTGYCSCIECVMEPAPVQVDAWPCVIAEADFEQDTITLKMQCSDYEVRAGQHWLHTTQPAALAAPADTDLMACWVEMPDGTIDGIASMRLALSKYGTAAQPAQPAVQETVAHLWECLGRWSAYLVANGDQADCAPPSWLVDAVKKATQPAQPAVPDAITDSGEDPKYRAGWNECRETMLQILKARTL